MKKKELEEEKAKEKEQAAINKALLDSKEIELDEETEDTKTSKTDEYNEYDDDGNNLSISDDEKQWILYKLGIIDQKTEPGKNIFHKIAFPIHESESQNIYSNLPNGFTPDVFFSTLFKESRSINIPVLKSIFPVSETADKSEPSNIKHSVLNLKLSVDSDDTTLHSPSLELGPKHKTDSPAESTIFLDPIESDPVKLSSLRNQQMANIVTNTISEVAVSL